MKRSPPNAPTEPKPFAHLLRTRDIRVLWMLRILVRSIDVDECRIRNGIGGVWPRLRLPSPGPEESDPGGKTLLLLRLARTLSLLESRKEAIPIPARLGANLDLLARRFSFSQAECQVLAFAVCLRDDDALYGLTSGMPRSVNLPAQLSLVLGMPISTISKVVEPGSRLRRSNLVEFSSGGPLGNCVCLRRGGLRRMAVQKLKSVDELLSDFLMEAPRSNLHPSDYSHLRPGFSDLQRLIADALRNKRRGVNILLHGAPGTGKTELVRVLAQQLQVTLLNVADADENGESMPPQKRLSCAACGLFLIGRRNAIVCFDEVESIFNDGSELFGKQSTAESQKSFCNQMLEHNHVPVFWIANSIRGMDPAFARRFDLVIRLDAPPQKRRLEILERECGKLVPQVQLKRLAQIDHITPALVTRASSVVRRIGLRDKAKSESLLEAVLDGVLQAQGHTPLSIALRASDPADFDPALCNSSEDLDALAKGLAGNGVGRICLYGPPGTGKTAFGLWLAEQLGKPLVLRRVSDIQSPLIGVMERNLARAFATASRDGAILQIDEVDSFLQDRRQAQRSWEVSQVNEFLTQLESFEGLLIASTNLMDGLDAAALRRFDFKVRMDFLREEQVVALLKRNLDAWGTPGSLGASASRRHLNSLKLTPGDFAVVARRHRIRPFMDVESVIEALSAEATLANRSSPRSIGFV